MTERVHGFVCDLAEQSWALKAELRMRAELELNDSMACVHAT